MNCGSCAHRGLEYHSVRISQTCWGVLWIAVGPFITDQGYMRISSLTDDTLKAKTTASPASLPKKPLRGMFRIICARGAGCKDIHVADQDGSLGPQA